MNEPEVRSLQDHLRIRLVRVVAEGGMGTVYEGVLQGAEGFEKRVCVKTIKDGRAGSTGFLRRFIHEAKLVADLVHQNIVQIYKLGRSDGRLYMLMEFVHGVTLQRFVKAHADQDLAVPVELAAYIAGRLCRALAYAHGRRDREGRPLGIVHRDVSPKNVLLGADGEVKLSDFGVAKAAGFPEREGGVVVGKLSYMSPEQAEGLPVDGRSDLFSVGIILFEMLSLRKLFDPRTDTTELVRELHEKAIPPLAELNPEVPPALEAVVRRALERDPWKRFHDAADMEYDLGYFLAQRGAAPTALSLETYLRQIFPELYRPESMVQGESR